MCTHTTHTGQGSAKRREKESFTDISQWRLLNEDQRNVSLFLISSTKMRTAPFKKNGPLALTTGRDVCEVFWKQYLNQRHNWHRATSWEKVTCGTTYCCTSSGQQHSDWPQYEKTAIQCKSLVHCEGVDDDLRRGHEKTVPIRHKSTGPPWRGGRRSEERTREDGANQTRVPWSTVKGWTTIRHGANQTQVPWSTVKGWTTIWGEDTRRQCQSDASPLVHREGVDDDLRRGHEKTVPIRRESPGPPWRGGQRSEERTREDSANQTRVPWSTVKGWTTVWGEDTRRQCQSDASPLVYCEVVDDDLRKGPEKTAPIRRESPGPPWRGGRRSEERTREDSASQTRVPWSTLKGWTTIWGEDMRRQCQSDESPLVHHEVVDDDPRRGPEKTVPIRLESLGPPWRGGRWPKERMQCHSDASPLVHHEVMTTWGDWGHYIRNRRTLMR